VQVVARKLKKLGVEVMTGAKAKSWSEKGGRAVVVLDVGGKDVTVDADKVLVSVGPPPELRRAGPGEVGVKVERGFITVDRACAPTSRHLRHRRRRRPADAGAQGVARGGGGRGGDRRAQGGVRRARIPAVIFSDPEVASAGITADEAKQRGRDVKVGKFPFARSGAPSPTPTPTGS
jgi:dihydrolipoamide dehydrogenase